jgi:two-component system cell cycle sensor histidine kinase/response regulator CckA
MGSAGLEREGGMVDGNANREKSCEEQLRYCNKLHALGRLVGGVAHDFNNLLTILVGHAALLEQTPLDDEQRNLLGVMRQALQQSTSLCRQLLSLSRPDASNRGPLDLNTVLREVAGLLAHIIDRRVVLDVRPCPGPCLALADHGQMIQVLLNLCLNACDAMPRGGRLLLETDRLGPWACLRVSDTGEGMTPEVQAHIFEPFFTTRRNGRGNGVGLAIVADIVQEHGGRVECSSLPGRGTSFTICLPAANRVEGRG